MADQRETICWVALLVTFMVLHCSQLSNAQVPSRKCQVPVPQDRGNILYFRNDGSQPVPNGRRFNEGGTIVSRCNDPTRQRFYGSRERVCRGGEWEGCPASCDPQGLAVVVENTLLKDIAPNGTIFVSTFASRVHISCIDLDGQGQPSLQLYFENRHLSTYWVQGQAKVRHTLVNPSPSNSGKYTCQQSRSGAQHSIHVMFKDIRCPSVPYIGYDYGFFSYYGPSGNRLASNVRFGGRYVYKVAETVRLTCNSLYDWVLVGSGVSTCNYRGEWSPPLPWCNLEPDFYGPM